MNDVRRIAVLTSGGDAPGMNPAIRAVVRASECRGLLVYGVEDGFTGLLEGRFRSLTSKDVAGLTSRAGSMLGCAREPRMLEDRFQRLAIDALAAQQIDCLIVIGGSGTQQGAYALSRQGATVVGIPSTIDNDLPYTDTSLGVDTAINTAVSCVDMIKETMTSHRRIAVVQVMGRDSGYIAEQVALATGAEAVIVPERPCENLDALRQLADERMNRHHERHMLIIVAEGATSPSSADLVTYLAQLGFSVREEVLGHLQRGGKPTARDRILGARMGVAAVNAALRGEAGHYLTVRGGDLVLEPYESVMTVQHKVSDELLGLISELG